MHSKNEAALVHVQGVSKKFCRDLKTSLKYGLYDIAAELNPLKRDRPCSHDLRAGEFWAVKDISFDLSRGECLGLIGRNGAGKTTLLKMLNGLIKPDTGRIEMNGRVGALIALGAGFNPILTGRENIYVNGSVLGLSKREIDDKLEEIIDFAEIRDAIDAPVQSYSSGMQVRLGFSIATAIRPDILLLDEVLAVGDTAFKVKCYNKLRELMPSCATVIVSHQMFDISRICTRLLVASDGRTRFLGGVAEGILEYNRLNTRTTDNRLIVHSEPFITNVRVDAFMQTSEGMNSNVSLTLAFESLLTRPRSRLRLVFFDELENPAAEWDSWLHGQSYDIQPGTNKMIAKANGIRLRSGNYRIVVVLAEQSNTGYTLSIEQGLNIRIENPALAGAPYKI